MHWRLTQILGMGDPMYLKSYQAVNVKTQPTKKNGEPRYDKKEIR